MRLILTITFVSDKSYRRNSCMVTIGRIPREIQAFFGGLARHFSAPAFGHFWGLILAKSHQRFLLARDLCAISFLFAVTGPWSLLLFRHGRLWVLAYFSLMVSHYVVLSVVSRNHGNRMVCNVLAEESLAE